MLQGRGNRKIQMGRAIEQIPSISGAGGRRNMDIFWNYIIGLMLLCYIKWYMFS